MLTAHDLLREARQRSGMTQADLARRAGITQSVVSDYERGRREPPLTTLHRLIAATGHSLAVDLVRAPAPLRQPGELGRHLQRHRAAVLELAAARGARNVRVFGSVARGEDGPTSDIDLLVDLAPGTSLLALIGLGQDLGDLLGVPVDVVPADSLKAGRAEEILHDAVPL